MAERASKRSRLSSEDSEGTDDWLPQAMSMNNRPSEYIPPNMARKRTRPNIEDTAAPPHKKIVVLRLGRRSGRNQAAPAGSHRSTEAASRARRGPSQEPQRSIRLNLKAPPSRLRELKHDEDDEEEEEEAANAKKKRQSLGRESKNKKPILDEPSDDDDEEDDAEEDAEEDAEGEDDDEDMSLDDDLDEDDEPMPDAPSGRKPSIKIAGTREPPKPTPTARLKQSGITPVEEKEAASSMASDDEDDDEDPEEDPPDLENLADMDDLDDTIRADGLADSDLDSSDGEGGDGEGGDDDDGPDGKNGAARRRRAADPESLMALSNEAQKKKFFTAEQISMRRAEMARRRKDLSEKRNEEEKANTLKRLLEKPTPTRRSRAQVLADAEREEFGPGRNGTGAEGAEAGVGDDEPRASPLYARTVSGLKGSRVGAPDEWLGQPVGRVFDGAVKPADAEAWVDDMSKARRMVQVID